MKRKAGVNRQPVSRFQKKFWKTEIDRQTAFAIQLPGDQALLRIMGIMLERIK
jgi:hypothetical protein